MARRLADAGSSAAPQRRHDFDFALCVLHTRCLVRCSSDMGCDGVVATTLVSPGNPLRSLR